MDYDDLNQDDGSRKVRCHITLKDGTRWLSCIVHLPAGSRLSDVLNDERLFLPLQRQGNEIVIHKNQISFATEVN